MGDFRYGIEKHLVGTSFPKAMEDVKAALAVEGFGILMEIDIQKTLKQKLDVEFRRYVILGACNPILANLALKAEPHIGLLLPCNIVVQEAAGGGVVVSIADPRAMFALVDNVAVAPVAIEADESLRRVMEALK